MQFAHTAGSSGPQIELLVLAGAMLVLGVVFFFQRSVKPVVPLILVLGAFAVAGGAFVFKGEPSTEATTSIDATIAIESPDDGAEVPAGEPFAVEVALEGGTLTSESQSADETAGHLHVYVDGQVVSMPVDTAPEVELEPGVHEITVEFTQVDHRSFEPRIADTIEVTAR